jgi:serine/threonine protein kinase
MGEVYRARDTRLGRDVAIKVMPGALLQRPNREFTASSSSTQTTTGDERRYLPTG